MGLSLKTLSVLKYKKSWKNNLLTNNGEHWFSATEQGRNRNSSSHDDADDYDERLFFFFQHEKALETNTRGKVCVFMFDVV